LETTRPNLAAAMRIMAEVLKEPAFPAEEFEKMRAEVISSIEQQKSDPQAVAITRISRYMSPYGKEDPRYVGSPDEEIEAIKAVKVEEMKKFHADFYGASNATVAVVGDFDEAEIAKLTEELFGNWKSNTKYERLVSVSKDVPTLNENIETPDKANAFFIAMANLDIRDDDPEYPAAVLGNFMLGGGFLNSRLAVRIRQKEGLSYGVGSGLGAGSLDRTGSFNSYAIYAPENVEKLEKAYREEIEKMLKDGFTAEELAAAKSGYLQGQQVNRSQDGGLAGTLSNNLFLNRTMTWADDFEKKIAALTPEEVKAAMNKYLKADKISIIKAGDFKKAKEKAAAGEKK
jgi:zinc protease